MKTLIVRENDHGRTTRLSARTTYQTKSGNWIAEVDVTEFRNACYALCRGLKRYSHDDLHIEADQDDGGKEYTIVIK